MFRPLEYQFLPRGEYLFDLAGLRISADFVANKGKSERLSMSRRCTLGNVTSFHLSRVVLAQPNMSTQRVLY
jgi:hypothetical protein